MKKPQENSFGDVPDWAYTVSEDILNSLKSVDPMTYYHCLRVGEYSLRLAKAAGLNEYQQKVAQFAGSLHDVGKMGIEAAIIHKPDKLSEEEFAKMKSHSLISEQLVQPFEKNDFFGEILPSIRGHHERVDGRGYPDELAGDEIPVIARVILVVDTLDAMAQDRPYRKGKPIEAIYKEILRCAGSQFDLQLAKIFLQSHPYWEREGNDVETLSKLAPQVTNLKAA